MQSLSRGLTLLGELGRRGRPMTLTELTAVAGLHKSTVHRMLAAFVEHGLVQRLDGSRYAVGVGLYELAEAARSAPGATARWPRIRVALADLARATGQPAGFAVPRFGALVRSVTADPTGAPAPADADVPLAGTALGAAYLAYRPRPEAERVAARHSDDGYALLLGLGRTRARGYAVLDGVAAPVLGPDGLATAAVEVAVPAGDRLAVQRVGLAVVACARRVAGLLATPAEVSA